MQKTLKKILSIIILIGLISVSCRLFAQDTLSHDHRKWKQAYHILGKLYQLEIDTFSNATIPVFSIERETLVDFEYLNRRITISENLYDICMNMGKDSLNALAFVLAHELTHHYQRKTGRFACILHKSENIVTEDDFLTEKEADIYGHYAARLAGFSPCEIGERFIDSLYTKLSIDPVGYLPLEMRKKMITEACQHADTLVRLYECANYASILGKYDIAGALHDYLLARFPNKKMYYMTALNKLEHVKCNLIDAFYTKYNFPLVRDFQAEIRANATNNKEAIKELQKVEDLLSKALQKYPDYAVAHYYLLYAKHLKIIVQNPENDVIKQLTLWKELDTMQVSNLPHLSALHQLLAGILLSFSDQKEKGKEVWKKIDFPIFYAEIAQENISGIQDQTIPCKFKNDIIPSFSRDTIHIFPSVLHSLGALNVTVYDSTNTCLYHLKYGKSAIQLREITTSKIHTNSTIQEVEKLYGIPCRKIATTNNEMLYIYEENHVILKFNAQQKWAAYMCYDISD